MLQTEAEYDTFFSAMFLRVFVPFLLINALFRVAVRDYFTLLNEDAALILEGVRSLDAHGPLHWFTRGYGPSVIRPWQLLSFGVVGSFTTEPFHFYLVHTVILTLAQLAFYAALRKYVDFWPAFFAALIPSLTRAGSESTMWLSDQHDLFLLFFCSLTFLFFVSAIREERFGRSVLFTLATLLCCWGAFYSNEKASVFPLALLVVLLYEKKQLSSKHWIGLVTVLQIPLYFLFRYSVLGTAIGGYNDSFLDEGFFSLDTIPLWMASTLTSLFWQTRGGALLVPIGFLSLSAAFLIALTFTKNKAPFRKAFFLWLCAHLILALPTAQYALSLAHPGVFSTRMYWMPVISMCFGIGLLLQQLGRVEQSIMKWLGHFSFIVAFLVSSCGFSQTLTDFEHASAFTKYINYQFDTHCDCTDTKTPQTLGLPYRFSTVNVYTESPWIEYQQRYLFPDKDVECNDEARCMLYFTRMLGTHRAIPSKSSLSRLPSLDQLAITNESYSETCSDVRVLKRIMKDEPLLRRIRVKLSLSDSCLSELKTGDSLLLYRNGKPVTFNQLMPIPKRRNQKTDSNGQESSFSHFTDFAVDLEDWPELSFYSQSESGTLFLTSLKTDQSVIELDQ